MRWTGWWRWWGEARPDALIVAGDVYDRAVPPADAVALLDETLSRIVRGAGVPVVMIAGNHDSAERLDFARRLTGDAGLHLRGRIADPPEPVVLEDAHGPVRVYPIPYAEPAAVRQALDEPAAAGHDAAMAALTDRARADLPAGTRGIVVAHAFVAGGAESESERPLVVGGSAAVDVRRFEGFCYTALGHLHRPQSMAGDRVRYSGSLLKYSFDEADHRKTVSLVEIGADGAVAVEEVALPVRRDVRIVEGPIDRLLADPPLLGRDDWLLARLTDTGVVLDAMAKLRQVYPNVLAVERPSQALGPGGAAAARDHRRIEPDDLFAAFWQEVTGDALTDAARPAVAEAVAAARTGDTGEPEP
jgi:exonuclease SbcD